MGNKTIDVSKITQTLPAFVEWCRKYIELKYQKKYNTLKIYTDSINYLAKYEEQNKTTIHNINNKLALQIVAFFTNNKRTHYLGKIKFLSKEYHNQYDQENHLAKYRISTPDKYSKGSLTQDDWTKIINYVPVHKRSQIFHSIFLFQYYSAGSRFGDSLALMWKDVGQDHIKRIEEKTGKERFIPLNNASRFIVNKYKGNASEYVFDLDQPTKQITNKEWCKYKSTILASMNSFLKTMQEGLDIKVHISSHTSRHTFATHSFEKTKDIKTTSLMIGHSKLATTEMYVHADNKLSKKLFDKVYE